MQNYQTMKITDYFKLVKPKYLYFRITADTSIRNYNSINVAKMIHHMYRKISERIYRDNKKIAFDIPAKCSYMIDIRKTNVDFIFIAPEQYSNIVIEKIAEVWPKATVEIVDKPMEISDKALKYELIYRQEDALSLGIDSKSNEPLNHILNVIDIIQDDDRVCLFYNFTPWNQVGWTAEYDRTIYKAKHKQPVTKQKKSFNYAAQICISLILDLASAIVDSVAEITGGEAKKVEKLSVLDLAVSSLNLEKDVKPATKKKRNEYTLNTQIIVASESVDRIRRSGNALSVCQSFKAVEENNELVHRRLPKNLHIDMESFVIPKVETNKVSISECQNFIQIPGRELLQQFPMINKVDTVQSEVPPQLQEGVMRIGISIFKGKDTAAYQTEDKELKNTAICICGPNRSGKSTLFGNMVYDAIKDGRTVILPDFCGNCKLSNELAEVIPKENIFNIECNDFEVLQGFGYNELDPKSDSPFEVYNCAKMKTARLKEFINLVNDGDNDLEGRMERFLGCAAIITFVNGGSVNDVFKMIKDHKLRHQFIDNIPQELQEYLEEYAIELCEIDEISTKGEDKGEIIGTKLSFVSAILSRVYRLNDNSYIEMMLKKDTKDNVNLVDMIQTKGGKLICLKMYDSMFVTQQQKDIYVCYWMTKIWGALQMRFCECTEELIQTCILIDELYQVKNCERYLTMILSQIPKYRAKLILSCHHLAQIDTIQEELRSAMCTYIFMRGSNKKNFFAMREEFEDKGFSLDDLLHLKEHCALCLVAYEEGYWAGICLTPPPVNESMKKVCG